MSAENEKGTGISGSVEEIVSAYREMEMGARRYLGFVVLPLFFFFLLIVGAVIFIQPAAIISALLSLLGIFAIIVAVVYPKVSLESRKTEINEKFHIYLTHMTVLSTTNIDRVEVFRELSKEEEYGEIAKETRRIIEIVETWNQSLDDACKRRSKKVPSDMMSDFLDRLAYTMRAGRELNSFLVREQENMLDEYVTMYNGELDNLDVLKDLYLSMVLSTSFGMVFAVILPILTDTDPTIVVAVVVVIFGFIQMGFLYAISVTVPHDPVWYIPDETKTDASKTIRRTVAVAVVVSFGLAAGVVGVYFGVAPFAFGQYPMPMYLAVAVSPFLIPGILIRRLEKGVTKRDEVFPEFVRGLGSVESAKQTTTTDVLKDLRKKDFGNLTPEINNLYKRLNMRIEPSGAWKRFTYECGSYLIQKFSSMYLVGREMGGDPRHLGELISENFSVALNLRENRKRMTVTIIGVLYGMTAAMSFALFLGVEIVRILTEVSSDFELSEMGFGQLLYPGIYNLQQIGMLILVVVLLNAIFSSLMIRSIDGGHKANASLHFVALTWLGCGIGIGTARAVDGLITVG
ncbi:archaellar assembly protein FlaJ [Haladaptatus sp. F3-133]|uniref:Archaellar assembly protein FlaJ n=1 Tax=Halorutilus salinus TaxID=2487751 RepID=A0A9Q4GG81_9EURY|nr:archaellar assembly protein FlaJ [Halorutilus salinus]MCX2818422.1 archaellar assembly protein FlaJ [Halorutilus salinus]